MNKHSKPKPNNRQNTYIVLFDDNCRACQTGIGWLNVFDKDRKTKKVPISESSLGSINPNLKIDECMQEIHVIGLDGEIYRGSSAIAKVARLFPSTWLVGVLISIPPFSWIASLAYNLFARNRYRLNSLGGNACGIPTGSSLGGKNKFNGRQQQ